MGGCVGGRAGGWVDALRWAGLWGEAGWGGVSLCVGWWAGDLAGQPFWLLSPPQACAGLPQHNNLRSLLTLLLHPLSLPPLPATPPPADSGAKVVVGHQAFGEMALHFLEKYGIMALKIPSKFDLRRFCRATGEPGVVMCWRWATWWANFVGGCRECVLGWVKSPASVCSTLWLRASC